MEVLLMGDIGKVSASTFALEVIPYMNTHDIWVSIQGEERQVLIEFTADVGNYLRQMMVQHFGIRRKSR